MLQTRIPVPRLVDWTDQAILHLHVSAEGRLTLRSHGIRTATDLITGYCAAQDRDGAAVDGCGKAEAEFLAILGQSSGAPPRIATIVDALLDEEWIVNLRHWHAGQKVNAHSSKKHSD